MKADHVVVIDNETQAVAVYTTMVHSMDDYNRIGFNNSIQRREVKPVQVMRGISALQAWGVR
ncbi:MAG: hypothetical protein P4L77_10685 [Sulfuriferula sp.]|nr:hypothetical protein [Sulfuriferula sp.]